MNVGVVAEAGVGDAEGGAGVGGDDVEGVGGGDVEGCWGGPGGEFGGVGLVGLGWEGGGGGFERLLGEGGFGEGFFGGQAEGGGEGACEGEAWDRLEGCLVEAVEADLRERRS